MKLFILLIFFANSCFSSDKKDSLSTLDIIANRIFLPSFDIGYIQPITDLMEGDIIVKTSIEYRIRNNNDIFIRLTYDTYTSKYFLKSNNLTTNNIEGTASFSDLYIGSGYRFGDETIRFLLSVNPGIKFYEFPVAKIENDNVIIQQKSKIAFTTSFLSTLEYYFDEKSALTVSVFNNQVWEEIDFWAEGGSSIGLSLGFITALQ
jgi:hypothetical protein